MAPGLLAGFVAGAAVIAACRRGDQAQRLAAQIVGLSWPLSQAACLWPGLAGPTALLILDLTLGLAAVGWAWKSPRLWPALAAAVLAVATATHLIVLVTPAPSLQPHAVLTQACRLAATLILAGAATRRAQNTSTPA